MEYLLLDSDESEDESDYIMCALMLQPRRRQDRFNFNLDVSDLRWTSMFRFTRVQLNILLHLFALPNPYITEKRVKEDC